MRQRRSSRTVAGTVTAEPEVRFRPFLHPEGSRQAQGGGTQRVPPRTESLGHRQTGSHASFGRRSSSSWEAETSSPNKRRRMDREQAVGVQHDPQYQARVTVRGQAIARDSSALSPGKVAKTSAGMPTESASSLKRKREEQPDEEAEMCPICLCDVELKDKAVINTCMHVFCLLCLTRWVQEKRVCPMCKGPILGYMYDIINEKQYQETILPASPPRSPPPTGFTPTWIAMMGQTIINFRSPEFRGIQFRPAGWHTGRRTRQYRARTATRRPGSRWDQGPPEPEPVEPERRSAYYYRVHQHVQQTQRASMLAMARRDPRAAADSPQRAQAPVVQDLRLRWRHHIYSANLWALDGALPGAGRGRRAGLWEASEPGRIQLRQWVDRELRAVLEQDDVAIVCSMVMGLINSYGLQHFQGNSEASHRFNRELRPFLERETDHFLHELRCFAASRMSMHVYDQTVQYSRVPPPPDGATEVRRPVQVQSGFTAWSAQEASRVPESRVLQAVLDRVSFPIPPLPVSNRDPNPPAVIDLTSSPAASPVRSVQDSDDDVFFLGTLEGRSAQNRARRPAAAPPAAEPSQRTRAHSPVPSQRDARSPGAVRGAEPVTSAFAATHHEHGLSPSQRWPSPAELSAERDRLPMLRTTQVPRQQSSTEGRLATGELGREHTRGRADGAQQAGGPGEDRGRMLSRDPQVRRISAPRIAAGRGRTERRALDHRRFSRSSSVSPTRERRSNGISSGGHPSLPCGVYRVGPSRVFHRDPSPSLTSPTDSEPLLIFPLPPSPPHRRSVSAQQWADVRGGRGASPIVPGPGSLRSRPERVSGSRAKSPGGSTEAMVAGPWVPAEDTTRDQIASSARLAHAAADEGCLNHQSMSAETGPLLPRQGSQRVPSSEVNHADRAGARGGDSAVRLPSTSSQGLVTGEWQTRRREWQTLPSLIDVARSSQRTHEQGDSASGLGVSAGGGMTQNHERSAHGHAHRSTQVDEAVGTGIKYEALVMSKERRELRPPGTGRGQGDHVGSKGEEEKKGERVERPWKTTRTGNRLGINLMSEQSVRGPEEELRSRRLDGQSGPQSPNCQATSPRVPLSPHEMRVLAEERLRSMGETPP